MAENSGVHRVLFKNETTETVTFIVESNSGPQTAFTLIPNGPGHFEEVQTPLTHEQLRLVMGEFATGHRTNEFVSTDDLAGLDEVVVTWAAIPGNNAIVLRRTPRNANAGPLLIRFWRRWFWPRNEGAPRDRRLGV